jgi:hypothetical protein
MSKKPSNGDVDSVAVAAEKLYEIIEGHLADLPASERKKDLEAIDEIHSRLTSRGSKKPVSKRRASRGESLCPSH